MGGRVSSYPRNLKMEYFLKIYFLLYSSLLAVTPVHCHCGVSFVLIGSTGDLAKRYLWPALFHHFMKQECIPGGGGPHQECRVLVVGGSREPVSEDRDGVWREVLSGVNCKTVTCELCLRNFILSSYRLRIGHDEDYETLSKFLRDSHQKLNQTEVGRVFYLSVPPSAYLGITKHIDSHCHPEQKSAWLRVILEKPFGRNLPSATLLAGQLAGLLKEDEIYRVDHYLGKDGVKQILPFRKANSDKLQVLWNKEHVHYVEVSMRERLDVKGRSAFFDKYGVIRDVHQNHLTEVLARILMEPSSGNVGKNLILTRLSSPSLKDSILGQYADYRDHLVEDGVLESNTTSLTPTYASLKLHLRDPAWSEDVPLVLTAGKQLGERVALARIVFKQPPFSPSSVADHNICRNEIVFLIQDEEIGRPGILISSHFANMSLECGESECERSIIGMGNCSYEFLSPSIEVLGNAYIPLMEDILKGNKENFVDTESLLNSWKIWDPLLSEIEASRDDLSLIQYSPDNLQDLYFHID